MAVCFRETRETISLLRRVVDKLDESNGYISAEDLWDGVECVPANVGSPDLTVARHGMRQMEAFSDVLQSFLSTLVSTYKTHTSNTRRRARILQLTVNSLPNEIIHDIVKDAFDCRKPIWLVRYSHVSSKIRNVILDSPSLWASIPLTIDIPSSLIKAITSRSAAFMLTVDLDISGRESFYSRGSRNPSLSSASVVSRLSAMLEHHQRWKELTLSIENEPGKLISQNFPIVHLTSVRVLCVDCDFHPIGTEFFQKWEIPHLEKLCWGNPSRSPPISMATQTLRLCSLELQTTYSNVLSVTAFLNAATSLQALELELERGDDIATTELPEIRLSCLEYLDIECDSYNRPTAILLLKSILCPGLEHFLIRASTLAEYSGLTENMRERYPMLTAFTLFSAGDFFFDEIMGPLPNTIKELKILPIYDDALKLSASRRDDIVPQNFGVFFPNLTNLDLEKCTIQGEGFYDKLSEILRNFRVSLDHFRPSRRKSLKRATVELEAKNAIMTLQRAGVLTI